MINSIIDFLFMMKFLFLFFIIMFISSCSGTSCNKCIINGDERYLQMSRLDPIVIPYGCTLPIINNKYIIPSVNKDHLKVGKDLDICPPLVIY